MKEETRRLLHLLLSRWYIYACLYGHMHINAGAPLSPPRRKVGTPWPRGVATGRGDAPRVTRCACLSDGGFEKLLDAGSSLCDPPVGETPLPTKDTGSQRCDVRVAVHIFGRPSFQWHTSTVSEVERKARTLCKKLLLSTRIRRELRGCAQASKGVGRRVHRGHNVTRVVDLTLWRVRITRTKQAGPLASPPKQTHSDGI